jgi:hypothetical protein
MQACIIIKHCVQLNENGRNKICTSGIPSWNSKTNLHPRKKAGTYMHGNRQTGGPAGIYLIAKKRLGRKMPCRGHKMALPISNTYTLASRMLAHSTQASTQRKHVSRHCFYRKGQNNLYVTGSCKSSLKRLITGQSSSITTSPCDEYCGNTAYGIPQY